ncbi:MAG: FMN-binding protein [Clostridia bacterium]
MNTKKIVIPTVSLFLICLVGSLLLAFTNSFTKDKISESAKKAELEQRAVVLQGAEFYEEKAEYIIGYDKEGGNLIGYIIISSAKGYAGEIKVMVGFKNEKISGVSVLSHNETNGVGSKAMAPEFLKQFTSKSDTVSLAKDIDAITGATRSSKAVTDAVNSAIEIFKSIGGDNK